MHPSSPSLPLLLKSGAAALTGAAALLIFRRLHRDEAVSSIRRDIRDALLRNGDDDAPPPAILVMGFRSHGRSSFINTACRALAAESGSLLLRAETAPPGPTPATVVSHVVRAAVAEVAEDSGEGEEVVAELLDAPPLPEPGRLTRSDIETALEGGGGAAAAAECVVVVLRCSVPAKERHQAVKKLRDIASVVRERGLSMVVVLTHKKALKSMKQAEELHREVALRARTDCVYFIENYNSSKIHIRHPVTIKNDFETHTTVLAIIRQCVQFAMMHRNYLSRKQSAAIQLTSKPSATKE